jgi:diguanylate cyclase (GGDEF)-like protein
MSDEQTVENTPATVLVVDDDPQTATAVSAALASQNVEVRVATSAVGAKSALAAGDVSLIVLNIVLPDADGRLLLMQFEQDPMAAGIPVIIVLGFFGPQPRDECLRLGAIAVLDKPLNPDQLRATAEEPLQQVVTVGRDPHHDRVTGLISRAAFAEAFTRQLADASAGAADLSIARLDFDASVGGQLVPDLSLDDEMLKAIGARLAQELPTNAIVVRWQEDEFVVLMPNTDTAHAVDELQETQHTFNSTPFERPNGATMQVTFSGGVVPVEPETLMDEAVATADHLLIRARTAGQSQLLSPEDPVQEAEPTILVAEDDRVAAALVKHRLARAGFEVVHHDNGATALDDAMGRNVALFVLDIRMPAMDGLELLKRLRESPKYDQTPILMLTSLGREEDIVRAFDLGASDYVTKPFSPVELLARVHRLLRRAGANAQ